MNKKIILLITITVIMVSFTAVGCKSNDKTSLDNELVGLVQQYIKLVENESYDEALKLCSGDWLESLGLSVPKMKAIADKIETKISDLTLKCDFINRDKTRARVNANYVMEQTYPVIGTTVYRYNMAYHLYKTSQGWKIYRVEILSTTPKSN